MLRPWFHLCLNLTTPDAEWQPFNPDVMLPPLCCVQDVVRLEQQLHDLMARMTQVKLQARYFSLPEEYQPNPHFNPVQALTLQAVLGVGGGGADSPAPGIGGKGAAGRTGMAPSSEAVSMDQDG